MSASTKGLKNKLFIRTPAVSLAASVSTFAVAPALAQNAAPMALNIPAQPAADAIRTLARQTGTQILFDNDRLRRIRSRAVNDVLTARQALGIMLAGSGLEIAGTPSGAIVIRPTRAAGGADNAAPVSGETQAGGAAADSGSADASQTGVAEILVIGSRSQNVDIRRTENDPQPYVVFGAEEIRQSNANNLEGFLRARLPMNTTSDSNSQFAGLSSRSSINLRGLGTNQTLILVDGRRLPRVSTGAGGFDQADVNGIPVSAIERIEVLPSTASGIYGGGATGGVINIILRRDYQGIVVNATYGNSFRGDAANVRLDVNGSFLIEDGNTRITFGASYSDSEQLLIRDRGLTQRARDRLFANNPAAFISPFSVPLGLTTNIQNSVANQNLILKPQFGGTVLPSPFTSVPIGYSGIASDNAAALVSNAGRFNLQLPNTLGGNLQSLLNNPTTSSAIVGIRRSFGPLVEAYADFAWFDNRGYAQSAAVPDSVTLPATAPNNPFTTSILVRFPATGLVAPIETQSEALRATVGAIVRLPHRWTAGAEFSWSRSSAITRSNTAIVGDPDGAGPGVSATTALGNGTLDIVRDLNSFPLNWAPYLLSTPNFISGPSRNELTDTSLRISGPLFRLPGGDMTVTGSIQRRTERADDQYQQNRITGVVVLRPERQQNVTSFYIEANAPIVAPQNAIPAVSRLDLQASVRRDRYLTTSTNPSFVNGTSLTGLFPGYTQQSNTVEATKYTLAIIYAPIEGFSIRISHGTGFLPPSIDQLTPNVFPTGLAFAADPLRGNVPGLIGPFVNTSQGNPNLQPENSRSWSAGVIIQPRFISGLRLSADYTRIDKSNEIATLFVPAILAAEADLPGRVTRNPLTPADIAAGFTGGVITAIDQSLVNAQSTRVEAIDFQADYELNSPALGTFRFYLVGTHQISFERQLLSTSAAIERAGFLDGPLRWRGNAGLTWSRGRLTAGWNTQYYGSHLVYAGGSTAATIASAVLNQGARRIPAQSYSDVFVTYRFGEGPFPAGTELSLGIQNLFDQQPPLVVTTGTTGGYSFFGDPRLRRFTVSLRARF